MDGSIRLHAPPLDVSSIAGRITAILAARHARAAREGGPRAAARFDVGLDTIYFASLLLMVSDGTETTRGRTEVLGALQTAEDVITELRTWLETAP